MDVRDNLLAKVVHHHQALVENGIWAERNGRLHTNTVQILEEIGVPRLFLPKGLGGLEVDPTTCALVCEALADADPAAAWHVMVYNSARLMAGNWSEGLVEALWGDDPNTLVSASGHNPFFGERRGDKYVVRGCNSFISGCHHAKYIMSPMMVEQQMYTVVMPMSECQIVDNWDTAGMRGTGSNDVVAEDVLVDSRFVVPMTEPIAGQLLEKNRYYQGRLYQCPARIVFATYIPIAMSLARRATAELSKLVAADPSKKLAVRPMAQQHFGRALANSRAAKDYFYAELERVWALVEKGGETGATVNFGAEQRADLYLAGTHAMQASADAVKHVIDAAGSASLHKGQPLERIYRDMEALRHHGFANESRYSNVAQVHWGVDLDYPLLLR